MFITKMESKKLRHKNLRREMGIKVIYPNSLFGWPWFNMLFSCHLRTQKVTK